MKKLILFPAVLIALFILIKRAKSLGSDIVLPQAVVQEKIVQYANKWRLDPALVKAVVKVESNFDPAAKNPLDPSYGLMQITPTLAYDYGLIKSYTNPSRQEIEMIYNVDNNLSIGCEFLSMLMDKYDFNQAIQSYNVGEKGYIIYGSRNTYYLERVRKYYYEYS